MTEAARLDAAVSAVAPIVGVSLGTLSDRATWRVAFAPAATQEQRAAAAAVLATFDISAIPKDAVNAERDRRLMAFQFNGKMFDFCDGSSDINIAGAGTLALAAIMAGAQPGNLRWADPSVDFTWVAADNTSVPMDAHTTLNFAKAAADWKARLIRAARTIKDMSPIPADYASDARWPS